VKGCQHSVRNYLKIIAFLTHICVTIWRARIRVNRIVPCQIIIVEVQGASLKTAKAHISDEKYEESRFYMTIQYPVKARAAGQARLQGFTLIELLVVIAVIAILASILFPVFARARENARRSSCASNLKQIGLGVLQYTQDYDETFPPYFSDSVGSAPYVKPDGTKISSAVDHGGFKDLTMPYIKSDQVFSCPSDTGNKSDSTPFRERDQWNKSSFYFNGFTSTAGGEKGLAGHLLASVDDTSRVVMTSESSVFGPFSWHQKEQGDSYNDARSNVCFVDGHVKFIKIYYEFVGGNVPPKYDPPAGYEYRWSVR
jgi:prepilin-type N-terminal cleavage/methylation domain-containing protein/prepilin-type processing-associated H-X9-DG protein